MGEPVKPHLTEDMRQTLQGWAGVPSEQQDNLPGEYLDSVKIAVRSALAEITTLRSRLNAPAVDWEKVEKEFREIAVQMYQPPTVNGVSNFIVNWFRQQIEGAKP